jgi:DNA (cytosine-5)-methyltransferase 1
MAQHNTDNAGHQMEFPVSTIIGKGCTQGLVAAHIKRDFGTSTGAAVDTPLPTITSDGGGHASLVASFMTAYYGNEQRTAVSCSTQCARSRRRIGSRS